MSIKEGKLFGTNGIRGIFGKDLSIDFIIDVTYSIGSFFKKGSILIGYDGRSSSFTISKIISSVLRSMGFDVYDMGLTPTPCLQYTVKNFNFTGGIMITASHNPKEYNGIKPVSPSGIEISRDDEKRIESIYSQKEFLKKENSIYGSFYTLDTGIDKYIDKVLSIVDVDLIRESRFKIVMDCGNGVQSMVAPLIAKKLGCEVLIMNGYIDANFSARGSEPKMENLTNLTEMVKKTSSNLGVAYDGDGDRSIFCDEKGIIHWGDKTGSILSYHLIKNKNLDTNVVCPINSSLIISKICSLLNSKVFFTKVGSVEVSYGMKNTQSLIGFEENGGFFYGPVNQVRDGAVTTALMLEMLSYHKQDVAKKYFNHSSIDLDKMSAISSIFSKFEKTYQYKSSLKLTTTKKIKTVLDLCSGHGSVVKTEKMDGVKIWFDTDSWIMFRPSGTEPLIRVYAESNDKDLLDSKVKEYLHLIKEVL